MTRQELRRQWREHCHKYGDTPWSEWNANQHYDLLEAVKEFESDDD